MTATFSKSKLAKINTAAAEFFSAHESATAKAVALFSLLGTNDLKIIWATLKDAGTIGVNDKTRDEHGKPNKAYKALGNAKTRLYIQADGTPGEAPKKGASAGVPRKSAAIRKAEATNREATEAGAQAKLSQKEWVQLAKDQGGRMNMVDKRAALMAMAEAWGVKLD